jgi:hypothetical protein
MVPKEITISRNCGANQRINFRIVDGSHGEFTGRAHCSELLILGDLCFTILVLIH